MYYIACGHVDDMYRKYDIVLLVPVSFGLLVAYPIFSPSFALPFSLSLLVDMTCTPERRGEERRTFRSGCTCKGDFGWDPWGRAVLA